MNRVAGIVIAVLGLIMAGLSYARVLPGLTQTGVVLFLFGGLIFGLSFVPAPADEAPGEDMSTPSTLVNIFFSPTDVFQSLRKRPRWLAAVIIMTLLSAVFSNAFIYRLGPERIVNFTIDKSKEMPGLNDDMRRSIEASRPASIQENKNPVKRALQAVSGMAALVFWIAFAAALFMLFIMALGGKIHYWRSFAAVTYAMFPVNVIRNVLGTIILFIKDPSDIHPILGQSAMVQDNLSFLVNPATNPGLYSLLAAFGLLSFYWLWLNATGLKNTGESVSSTAAWTSTLVIWSIGIVLGVLFAVVFRAFMS